MFCNCWYSPCMFSISALRSAIDSGVILGSIAMAETILTDSEVLEIMYNSDESFSDSSSDSVSSSDNKIDDSCSRCNYKWWQWWWRGNIASRFQVRDCGQLHRTQRSVQLWFWTQKWCRKCDIVQCFELFFDKEIIQQIVRETNRYTEQYKNAQGTLFSFRSFVRSWTPVRESEIYSF